VKKYLLDTNICICFLKGQFELDSKIEMRGIENCYLSEITVAELKFGAENSHKREENLEVVSSFIAQFTILPIINSLDIYAKEKARLRKKGIVIDEFDLLIGATAIINNMVLVTNNEKHFKQLHKIQVENWTSKNI
jgi:tRNA(fMet)-specific endonuclease VapC